MMQRWSKKVTEPLRTFTRRGALLLLVPLLAIVVTISPLATRPANAQLTDLLSLGGSFTNGLSSCAIETVGWVICPTMRSIAKLADYGFTYMNQDFLKIDYGLAANDSGTYKAWEIMRNIANGLFVVAFMVLIYSQLTGRSSGGYSIKRLLPRLIIAAVLVNVSYFVCVLLIDVSNLLGGATLDILKGVAGRIGTSPMPLEKPATAFQDGTLSVITSSIMAKTGVAWVLLAPVSAVIISIATICAAGLVLLIMRKTLVAMLILVSPILFVAYLLPNTERFFTQGARLFIQMLLLYPIIALLLGAGQIVSATIASVGTGGDTNYRVTGDNYFRMGGSGSAITDLTASAAAVVPLLGVWFMFKGMNTLMSTAGSRLSATMAGRRGGNSDDKKARVTGKAHAGAANLKNNAGVGNGFGNRRQAFSRNRRRPSLGGSALTGEEGANSDTRAGMANRRPAGGDSDALQNSINGAVTDSTEKKLEELQNARIDGDADGLNVESAVAAAVAAGQGGKEQEKQKTAKDIFNNLNRGHESKDKDRKFNSGPAPAGGSSGGGGGAPQPTAPSTSYRAPTMAQNNNIVSGSAPQQPVKIVAVPVQVDASALVGQQQHRPPENVTQPPISGTEEKAKARAQKYLFNADREIKEASDRLDILGQGGTPAEQPHTAPRPDEKEDK